MAVAIGRLRPRRSHRLMPSAIQATEKQTRPDKCRDGLTRRRIDSSAVTSRHLFAGRVAQCRLRSPLPRGCPRSPSCSRSLLPPAIRTQAPAPAPSPLNLRLRFPFDAAVTRRRCRTASHFVRKMTSRETRVAAPGGQSRLDRRGRRPAGARPPHRAHGVQRQRPFQTGRAGLDVRVDRRAPRPARERVHQLRRDRLHARPADATKRTSSPKG